MTEAEIKQMVDSNNEARRREHTADAIKLVSYASMYKYVCMNVYMYVCMFVCIYVCIYVYTVCI